MSDGVLWHRIQFGFTVTYPYLFPQLTVPRAPDSGRARRRVSLSGAGQGTRGVPVVVRFPRRRPGDCDVRQLPGLAPRSTLDRAHDLTLTNTASGSYALRTGLAWFVVGVSLAAACFVLVFRIFRGKVALDEE